MPRFEEQGSPGGRGYSGSRGSPRHLLRSEQAGHARKIWKRGSSGVQERGRRDEGFRSLPNATPSAICGIRPQLAGGVNILGRHGHRRRAPPAPSANTFLPTSWLDIVDGGPLASFIVRPCACGQGRGDPRRSCASAARAQAGAAEGRRGGGDRRGMSSSARFLWFAVVTSCSAARSATSGGPVGDHRQRGESGSGSKGSTRRRCSLKRQNFQNRLRDEHVQSERQHEPCRSTG